MKVLEKIIAFFVKSLMKFIRWFDNSEVDIFKYWYELNNFYKVLTIPFLILWVILSKILYLVFIVIYKIVEYIYLSCLRVMAHMHYAKNENQKED